MIASPESLQDVPLLFQTTERVEKLLESVTVDGTIAYDGLSGERLKMTCLGLLTEAEDPDVAQHYRDEFFEHAIGLRESPNEEGIIPNVIGALALKKAADIKSLGTYDLQEAYFAQQDILEDVILTFADKNRGIRSDVDASIPFEFFYYRMGQDKRSVEPLVQIVSHTLGAGVELSDRGYYDEDLDFPMLMEMRRDSLLSASMHAGDSRVEAHYLSLKKLLDAYELADETSNDKKSMFLSDLALIARAPDLFSPSISLDAVASVHEKYPNNRRVRRLVRGARRKHGIRSTLIDSFNDTFGLSSISDASLSPLGQEAARRLGITASFDEIVSILASADIDGAV